MRNVGLVAGERNGIQALGTFGRLIGGAPTLGAALESAARYSRAITSNRPVWLRPRGDLVDFCMAVEDGVDPRDVGWQQDDQFCLGLMISAVRLAAGPRWRPTEVCLQTGEAPGLRDAESLAGARIAFEQPATIVTIPRALLSAPLSRGPVADVLAEDVVGDWESSAPVHDFTGSVRQAVETLSCGDGYPTVSETAAFVWMSVRTLQRRLAALGTSHDALVGQTRFAMAAAVLQRTDAKILDLALDLGYSDHANFTRAFRRWAGCSPREYRSKCGRRR
jgi:AraC-like DNA-binding protein